MDGPGGLREVNPELPGGRHALDYRTYLGLDALLGSQLPASLTPDERCFIITHQLFEIVFKLMIFDFAVVAETLQSAAGGQGEEAFHAPVHRPPAAHDPFWRPALTASGRLQYSGRVILPAVIGYLLNVENKDETFSSLEFYLVPRLHRPGQRLPDGPVPPDPARPRQEQPALGEAGPGRRVHGATTRGARTKARSGLTDPAILRG